MNLKKALIVAFVLSLFTAAAFAAPLDVFKDIKGALDIAGGTAHIPVMKQAAQEIMTAYPNIRITVAGGGSGVGVKQVGEGLVGIGNTGRPLKDSEIAEFGLKTFPFAIDGVAVTVNPANPVKEMTSAQVSDIYSSKITDWKELGGEAGKINVYGREDGSGTRETFTEKILGETELAPSVNVVASNGAMKTAVAQDKRAIGYVGIGHIEDSITGVVLDGMVPSQENAADGTYKIVRNLYMNTKGEPTGLTAAFIGYIYSKDGAKIIEDNGYIPIPKD
ncbi:MAG: phosphate ABC transporter substrate-binding protein PstS family protein [Synergistaceae bacterium]|jgi:phosphate transport system substrate-binding protein|nr:phosphate ABC transporter substrate-binding protein PstS family protein [Synergistaceae bacterium]